MPSDGDNLSFNDQKKKWPKVLAFDTSGPFVAVGWAADSHSGGDVVEMARGQAESLFPLLQDRLASLGWTWADVDTIGVGIGPGNFTGTRISVSAARGLGLALGIPVVGISAFEAGYGPYGMIKSTVVSLPAPKGQAYVQAFDTDEMPLWGPGRMIDPEAPPRDMQLSYGMTVHGFRARLIASFFETDSNERTLESDPAIMAEIAERRYMQATAIPPPPDPLYIRPADAAPARDAPPVFLDL